MLRYLCRLSGDERLFRDARRRSRLRQALAEIDGYVVSGLVPVEIIERLISERPDVTGITLPGMPGNAPGMAPAKTGTLKTYAFGKNGVAVYSDE